MTLRHHEIAEAGHRILNPLVEPQLRLLGEIVGAGPRTRGAGPRLRQGRAALPLGELVRRVGDRRRPLARVRGGGSRAGGRARRRDQGQDRRGRRGCVPGHARLPSTSPAASGRPGSAAASRGRSTCCARRSAPAACSSSASRTGSSRRPRTPSPPTASRPTTTCRSEATFDRLDAAGVELVEMVLASPDTWDRYEASQWLAVTDWLAAEPGRPRPRRDGPLPGRQPALVPAVGPPLPRLGGVRHPASLRGLRAGRAVPRRASHGADWRWPMASRPVLSWRDRAP